MTDLERDEVSERAEFEGQVFADVVTPKLRGEIWKACATWAGISAFILFTLYRSDFAALREDFTANVSANVSSLRSDLATIRDDIKSIRIPVPVQQNQVNVRQAEGLLERETRRILESRRLMAGSVNDGDL